MCRGITLTVPLLLLRGYFIKPVGAKVWYVVCIFSQLLFLVVSSGLVAAFNLILTEPSGAINHYWAYIYYSAVGNLVLTLLALPLQAAVMYFVYKSLQVSDKELAVVFIPSSSSGGATVIKKGLQPSTSFDSITTMPSSDTREHEGGSKDSRHRHQWSKDLLLAANAVLLLLFLALSLLYLFTLITGIGGIATALASGTPSDHDDDKRSLCDPIVSSDCILPFPNSFYMKSDDTTPTKLRLQVPRDGMPMNRFGQRIDPASLNEADGFSTLAPILFTLEENVRREDLAGVKDISRSTSSDSTTLIIDSETLELIPHWTEIDEYQSSFASDSTKPSHVIIQPAVPLRHSRRYIVVVKGMHSRKGGGSLMIEPSEAFRRILTKESSGDRTTYFHEAVFPPISKVLAASLSTIQLAWDFTTVSRLNSLGRLEHIREDALSYWESLKTSGALESQGSDNKVWKYDLIEDKDCSLPSTKIRRTVWGHFYAPLYLQHEGPHVESFLLRDDGNMKGGRPMPYRKGTEMVNFVVRIPCSLTAADTAKHVVQFGHGIFGNRGEVTEDAFDDMINRNMWIMIGTDWAGMSRYDLLSTGRAFLTNGSDLKMLPERLMQGFVNQMLTLKLVMEVLGKTEELYSPSLIKADTSYSFYGNSQGAIVGGGYFSFNPQLSRGCLAVPGTPFALVLGRSGYFEGYYNILKMQFRNARDIRIIMSSLQILLDPAESAGWMSTIYYSTSPPSSVLGVGKRAIIFPAVGDTQVTTIAAHVLARSFRAVSVGPEVRPIYGVPERNGTEEVQSGIIELMYADSSPGEDVLANVPPPSFSDTHQCPHREPRVYQMMKGFFEGGVIANRCADLGKGGKCLQDTCLDETKYNRQIYKERP
jgi:hypothetical protein